jgi:hypothetical protein
VSHRAIDNPAFDIIAFITFKFQKGWAIFRALHIYAHGAYTKLQSPFAQVAVETLTLDENISKNLAMRWLRCTTSVSRASPSSSWTR